MRGPGNRSQSETLGVVLLLGMTVLSVGALAAYGNVAIDDARHSVDIRSAEHALSQLDSKVSLVALSDAERQSVSLGRGRQGTYSVLPDSGRITITHVNYTPGSNYEIYNETMGEVRYESGDTTLTYQGGGVWRSQGGSGSTMVSPPELYFRDMTLTMPNVRITGDGSISGSATARVSAPAEPRPVYPNSTDTYPNGTSLSNPVNNGTLRIAVQSDYYRAWGSYFDTRTDGNVTVYHDNQTAVVELVSVGFNGDFAMPMDGQPIELRAIEDGHPLSNFTVTIAPDQPDSQSFSGLSWSLWAKSGSEEFEVHLGLTGDGSNGSDVSASVYYFNGTKEQGWHDDDAFTVTTNEDGEARIVANLTSDAEVNYTNLNQNDLSKFQANNDFADSVTFHEHEETVNWEPETFSKGEKTTLGNTTNHYVGLMGPNVELVVKDGEGAGGGGQQTSAGYVNEDVSTGYISLDSTDQYVTYLHISENNVTVELE